MLHAILQIVILSTAAVANVLPQEPAVVDNVLPAVGPSDGGQNVHILGTDFLGATSVSFGTAASPTFVASSGTDLWASAPPHATGTASITVVTSAGTSSSGRHNVYTWNTSNDTPTDTYYGTDRRPAYLAMITAATSSITISTWNLSDLGIADALTTKAAAGVTVNLVENLSDRSGPEPALAYKIYAAGGHVYNNPVPRTIQNNFLTTDGRNNLIGPYYPSPDAIQDGQPLKAVPGTNTAAANASQYSALIVGGVPPTP